MKLFKALAGFGLAAGFTQNADGTGGSGTAPSIYQYVMMNADVSGAHHGYDPHAVHGIELKNGGYVGVGFSLKAETNTAKWTG